MQLGMIGLGRMGANMVRRLLCGGHPCVVYDAHPSAAQALAAEGAVIDEGSPAPVLSAALSQRFMSRGEEACADRVLSATRCAFGGHVERPTGG